MLQLLLATQALMTLGLGFAMFGMSLSLKRRLEKENAQVREMLDAIDRGLVEIPPVHAEAEWLHLSPGQVGHEALWSDPPDRRYRTVTAHELKKVWIQNRVASTDDGDVAMFIVMLGSLEVTPLLDAFWNAARLARALGRRLELPVDLSGLRAYTLKAPLLGKREGYLPRWVEHYI